MLAGYDKINGARTQWLEQLTFNSRLVTAVATSHYFHITEAVARRCSVTKVFLTITQSSLKNTSARVSFLINFI